MYMQHKTELLLQIYVKYSFTTTVNGFFCPPQVILAHGEVVLTVTLPHINTYTTALQHYIEMSLSIDYTLLACHINCITFSLWIRI